MRINEEIWLSSCMPKAPIQPTIQKSKVTIPIRNQNVDYTVIADELRMVSWVTTANKTARFNRFTRTPTFLLAAKDV